ncbi:MAG TPA: NADH-quinone oxidoreductase subunit NuoH [Acidimicrobiia bacterium]|jgi:NADH-quinone oxidoreductase subunit H|nr:NADH-quinone oxidoreductase subunit NuoH [Acidimicrobiia bacterium]
MLSGWEVFLEAAIKVVAVFALLLTATIFLVWIERKVVADMQNRVGPDRAGPFGILQTVADGVKLIFKENVTPRRVEFGLYIVAPIAALVPALLIFMVVPIGRPFTIGDRQIQMVGADLNIGVLYILALSSLAVYAVVLAGWSSGSKYPLLGSVRASAQMISYEAAMGLALVPVIIFTGTTSLTGIVEAQAGSTLGFLGVWNVVLIPSFVIFFIAGVAETNRPPFDLVEAESEIVGGYHTEYSGFRFALFFLAEYINMFNISAITVTIFFGGWHGPTFGTPDWLSWIFPIFWFLAKTLFFVFVFVWVRASLPRMRYDQLMSFGWKRLIPISLAWIALATIAIGVRRFGLPWA